MKSLYELYQLWDQLADIPVSESLELDAKFLDFEEGTPCEDVWHWFESQNKWFVVAEVQAGIRYAQDAQKVDYGAMQIMWPTAASEASLFTINDLARGVGMSPDDFVKACAGNEDFLADATRNVDPIDRESAQSDDVAFNNLKLRYPSAVTALMPAQTNPERPRG